MKEGSDSRDALTSKELDAEEEVSEGGSDKGTEGAQGIIPEGTLEGVTGEVQEEEEEEKEVV